MGRGDKGAKKHIFLNLMLSGPCCRAKCARLRQTVTRMKDLCHFQVEADKKKLHTVHAGLFVWLVPLVMLWYLAGDKDRNGIILE